MKCYIVQDLLPLYLDCLTSDETNTAIEKHLSECNVCSGILHKMQDDTIELIKVPDRLNPLRKIWINTIKNCIVLALGTLVILGLIILLMFLLL